MIKIPIFFEDLTTEGQNRLVEEVKAELRDEVEFRFWENKGRIPRETVEEETVTDYINRHNVANYFEL